jgi:hypothetical protein
MDNHPTIQDGPGPSGLGNTISSNNDDKGSWFLYGELNRLYGDDIPSPPSYDSRKPWREKS